MKKGCIGEKKPKKDHRKPKVYSALQTFDRIEWLKKRVLPKRLIDRTVKLKYLIHPSQMNEHFAIKKVFNRFDNDGNSMTLFLLCIIQRALNRDAGC